MPSTFPSSRGPDLFRRRSTARRRGLYLFGAILVALIGVAVIARSGTTKGGNRAGGGPSPSHGGHHHGGGGNNTGGGTTPIKHIIFIVKENRTFDNLFGEYPGADGTTVGKGLSSSGQQITIPLKQAPDVQPSDITHGFNAGILSIDGGKMDGFNTILYGSDLSGYDQLDRSQIPHYWDYADHFVLADRFFTSMYGPTTPEHLYTIAAQDNGIVDNPQNIGTSSGIPAMCDDPKENAPAFQKGLTDGETKQIMNWEDTVQQHYPTNVFKISQYWNHIPMCFNVKTLPDELTKASVSWKYYTPEGIYNAPQAIKSIRYGSEWKNVVSSDDFVSAVQHDHLPQVTWVNPPVSYNEHPGGGQGRLLRRPGRAPAARSGPRGRPVHRGHEARPEGPPSGGRRRVGRPGQEDRDRRQEAEEGHRVEQEHRSGLDRPEQDGGEGSELLAVQLGAAVGGSSGLGEGVPVTRAVLVGKDQLVEVRLLREVERPAQRVRLPVALRHGLHPERVLDEPQHRAELVLRVVYQAAV